MKRIALSIKQPWITLILAGIKNIEIRRWSRKFTGEILLHSGKTIDKREEGWRLLPPSWLEVAELRGGFVGKANVIGCKEYRSQSAFNEDCERHRNQPDWFVPPVMYGFQLAQPELIPFEYANGNLFFFEV